MIPGESILHYYCIATVKLSVVLMIAACVIGYIWYKWVRNR